MVVSTGDAAAAVAADITDSAVLDDATCHSSTYVTTEAGEDCTSTLMSDSSCVYIWLGFSRFLLQRESPLFDIFPCDATHSAFDLRAASGWHVYRGTLIPIKAL